MNCSRQNLTFDEKLGLEMSIGFVSILGLIVNVVFARLIYIKYGQNKQKRSDEFAFCVSTLLMNLVQIFVFNVLYGFTIWNADLFRTNTWYLCNIFWSIPAASFPANAYCEVFFAASKLKRIRDLIQGRQSTKPPSEISSSFRITCTLIGAACLVGLVSALTGYLFGGSIEFVESISACFPNIRVVGPIVAFTAVLPAVLAAIIYCQLVRFVPCQMFPLIQKRFLVPFILGVSIESLINLPVLIICIFEIGFDWRPFSRLTGTAVGVFALSKAIANVPVYALMNGLLPIQFALLFPSWRFVTPKKMKQRVRISYKSSSLVDRTFQQRNATLLPPYPYEHQMKEDTPGMEGMPIEELKELCQELWEL